MPGVYPWRIDPAHRYLRVRPSLRRLSLDDRDYPRACGDDSTSAGHRALAYVVPYAP